MIALLLQGHVLAKYAAAPASHRSRSPADHHRSRKRIGTESVTRHRAAVRRALPTGQASTRTSRRHRQRLDQCLPCFVHRRLRVDALVCAELGNASTGCVHLTRISLQRVCRDACVACSSAIGAYLLVGDEQGSDRFEATGYLTPLVDRYILFVWVTAQCNKRRS
jgi:hypothetical protein